MKLFDHLMSSPDIVYCTLMQSVRLSMVSTGLNSCETSLNVSRFFVQTVDEREIDDF